VREVGYFLSSEEHSARDLIRNAQRCEQAGFAAGMISDHYHPWLDRQGNSPFVWSVLGGMSQATSTLRIVTGVTCPIIRIHPAIIAQAAATVTTMMPGRFELGLGAGENLNEHIVGQHWPPAAVRLEMLEESVEVIRTLWEGGVQSHRGKYFTVEDARVFNLPEELPPIMLAAGGEVATKLAARISDGLIGTKPNPEQIQTFEENGGRGKPRYAKLTVCWAETDEEAVRLAHDRWPNAAVEGNVDLDIRMPEDFEQVTSHVRPEDVAKAVVCSADPSRHVAAIREFFDAGFTTVFVHQVGPEQDGFFRFYEREVLPSVTREPVATGKDA
jgi:coenzyme F420-dependent glucose-6-phosphate dehydrogenase